MAVSSVIYRNMFFILFLASVLSYNTNALSFKYFSTKTPYAWVQNISESEVDDNGLYNLTELTGMSCPAVHVSSVLRHGARFASLKQVHNIIAIHKKIKDVMKENVNPELYNWTNRFPLSDDKGLARLGVVEHEGLGRRTAKKLEKLLAGKYPSEVSILISSETRTNQSAYAFHNGIINIITGGNGSFDSKINNDLLKFYESCDKYVSSVEDNKTAIMEYDKFSSDSRLTQIIGKIEKKLNISSGILSTEDVDLIYVMCGYETALFNSSAWCTLLDDADMELLEYLEDLDSYYTGSYGYNITWQQSCPLVSEIFKNMDAVIEANKTNDVNGSLVGQFAFGHSETLGPLYAALGLFKDAEPLRADNYDKQKDRRFRSSKILPFSSNLMIVLYKCVPEGMPESGEPTYYLKLFVNEVPQVIPGCDDLYCRYSTVREHYSELVDKCNFAEVCSTKTGGNGSGGRMQISFAVIWLSLLILFFLKLF